MTKKIVLAFIVLMVLSLTGFSQEKTRVNSQYAKRLLTGRHMLSLQWISWDYFGRANVTQKNGVWSVTGTQKGRGNDDLLIIDGTIGEINRYEFTFKGKITTTVSHLNGGEPCVREGDMTFKITGKRKYWRLQEMDNPCDSVTDYIDIYFRR